MAYKEKKSPIKLSEFMDDTEELHAFTNGICEIICPLPPLRKSMSRKLAATLRVEYHYYMFGRAMGVIAWLIIATIIKAVFF